MDVLHIFTTYLEAFQDFRISRNIFCLFTHIFRACRDHFEFFPTICHLLSFCDHFWPVLGKFWVSWAILSHLDRFLPFLPFLFCLHQWLFAIFHQTRPNLLKMAENSLTVVKTDLNGCKMAQSGLMVPGTPLLFLGAGSLGTCPRPRERQVHHFYFSNRRNPVKEICERAFFLFPLPFLSNVWGKKI